jgi:hypothetical protein
MAVLNARKSIRGISDEAMTISLSGIQSASSGANSKVDLTCTFPLNFFHIMTCSDRAISLSWWTPLENTFEIKTQTPKGPRYVLFQDGVPLLFLHAYVQCPAFYGRLQGGPHGGGIEPWNWPTSSLSELRSPAEQLILAVYKHVRHSNQAHSNTITYFLVHFVPLFNLTIPISGSDTQVPTKSPLTNSAGPTHVKQSLGLKITLGTRLTMKLKCGSTRRDLIASGLCPM